MTLFFTILWTVIAGIVAVTVAVIVGYALILAAFITFSRWRENRAVFRNVRLRGEGF